MKKGNYGIFLTFYALLAFVLAFLGQTLLCGLLLGFVILAEKDEWASKQVMQAFFLTLFTSILSQALAMLNIFSGIPFVGAIFATFTGIITGLISFVILIFVIIAMVKVAKGKDAGIPVFSKLANRAFGIVEKKV
ncbi:MAG: hypothetical protein WAX04_09230, partial [Oscillospiraceae bacterium]